MSNHRVSRRWFTEAVVKDLRTIKIIHKYSHGRARIKRIVINKCDPLSRFQRNLILLFSQYKTFFFFFLSKWIVFKVSTLLYFVSTLLYEFRISTQIIVLLHCNTIIALHNTKSFPFFLWFKIYVLIATLPENGKLEKEVPWQVYFKDCVHRYRTAF